MIDTSKIRTAYFIGIGGIGMSALARYFVALGLKVYGYDRTAGTITGALEKEGCKIIYDDNPDLLPVTIRNDMGGTDTMVIYTPAIPPGNKILTYFRERNFSLHKRSEILGMISGNTTALAVAGTHGKTTVSTLLAHLMMQTRERCSAFLGGISKNYNTNLLLNDSRYTVIEADEFDRSFLRLEPFTAVITSADPDHLDIYGDYESMLEAYDEFIGRIRAGGKLIINVHIREKLNVPDNLPVYSYGFTEDCDFRALNIRQDGNNYLFDLKTPEALFRDVRFIFPGRINVENAVAASAVALLCGISEDELRSGLGTFSGVRRRFDIRINLPGLVYIDDYAHHPDEIRACISSVKEFYGARKVTGIFQPHLFSRTRDHAAGFAEMLDMLDDVIILPVYPARENPIKGVTSSIIFEKMKLQSKRLLEMDEVVTALENERLDVLLTFGAGDIDKLVGPIENMLRKKDMV